MRLAEGALPAVSGARLAFDTGRGSEAISSTGDNVVLYDPDADECVQILLNGDPARDPTTYTGFSTTATREGSVQDWGSDTDGISPARDPVGDTNILLHNSISSDGASPGAPGATGPGIGSRGDPSTLIGAVQGSGS